MSLEAWGDENPDTVEGNCRECEGTGEIIDDRDQEQTCPACGGSGWILDEPWEDDVI